MIRRIKGELLEKTEQYCVVMASGIGYKIFITPSCYNYLPDTGENVHLYTFMAVKEDAITLYGFLESEQLAVFELVLNVSGIGPKIALAVVGEIAPTQFYLSVLNNEISQLTRVPGIGKKSAQRVVLELKEKVKDITSQDLLNEESSVLTSNDQADSGQFTEPSNYVELKTALSSLGYTSKEIEKAVQSLQGSVNETMEMEDLLRLALQRLNKQ
ncbi:Holliday junction branch migration protein RuvA [Natranaerobius trueperi]|uniref:Holliday junction branch migration protein RuvA n=1 Tax=Natranaerobius trueperi TaxID=759412 RepID=UPI001303ED37|nr:Holliday junction branch migration protein RuvA [Natranaerobius trueperi]